MVLPVGIIKIVLIPKSVEFELNPEGFITISYKFICLISLIVKSEP